MPLEPGTHTFGPDNGTLAVRTGRTGAAAKAGHNLLIHVTAWQATLELGEDPSQASIVFDADATSLRVREGAGGIQALGDDDKVEIERTINDDVLLRQAIRFRSTVVEIAADGGISVQGELTLAGETRPVTFSVTASEDGTLNGTTVVKQSEWGIKPYSTLFGALKVVDEVEIEFELDATRRDVEPVPVAVPPARVAEEPDVAAAGAVGSPLMHLRAPSIDPGVSSFVWALVFFLIMFLGMLAVDVAGATALILALVASFLSFLFIRTQGAGRQRN